ncbi:hypothetical protein VNO77_03318 [Canavalia gladiata]|uniref:Uncharacterized protein n=1 Tax=Canavalia gladiata TaxID=3824 RepID=A0AAN9N059_CANGL
MRGYTLYAKAKTPNSCIPTRECEDDYPSPDLEGLGQLPFYIGIFDPSQRGPCSLPVLIGTMLTDAQHLIGLHTRHNTRRLSNLDLATN